MKVTDKRISGIHVTMLAALSNFSYFIHNFYVYALVERFGIFGPQAFLSVFGLVAWLVIGRYFLALDDLPVSAF